MMTPTQNKMVEPSKAANAARRILTAARAEDMPCAIAAELRRLADVVLVAGERGLSPDEWRQLHDDTLRLQAVANLLGVKDNG